MNAVSASSPSALTRLQTAFAEQPDSASPTRQQAFSEFLKRGFPTTRDELWKYTNLRRLEMREFASGQPDASYLWQVEPGAKYQLVFVDGYYREEFSSLPALTGVRVVSLGQLPTVDDDARTAALASPANQYTSLASLNAAMTQDGAVIDIDADTAVAAPIWLTFVWSDQSRSLMAHPRIVIRLGQQTKACVIEQYLGSGNTAHFNNVVTTLKLAQSAQLEHCRIQNENSSSFHVGLLHAELAAQASLTSHQINFGAALARMDINVLLQGAAASVSLNGLQFAGGAQHHDTHTRVEHCVPHTSSREDYRGIADQRGRVVFNGKVVVDVKAIKTDAQQSSRNLLLSSTAEIDAKPELEIYNDDVKCAHGATVGQLDANALFYLRSRGLDASQARALLTYAFADHIVAQLPVAALRQQLTVASHARFGTAMEMGA